MAPSWEVARLLPAIRMKHSGTWIGGLFLFAAGLGSGWAVRALVAPAADVEDEATDSDEVAGITVDPAEMRAQVDTVEATRGSLPIVLTAPGVVRASPAAEHALASRAGGRVLEIAALPGQLVHAGDLLLRLDPAASQAALSQARATLADSANRLAEFERNGAARQAVELQTALQRAIGQVGLLEAQLNRLEPLRADGLASEKTLAETRQELESARAERVLSERALRAFRDSGENLQLATLSAARDAAQLAVDEAQRAVAEVDVRAPADGRLIELSVRAGEMLAAGSALATLLVGEGREIVFQVPAVHAAKVLPGAGVTWVDAGGVAGHGTIVRLDAQVEPVGGTLEVIARPDADAGVTLSGLRVLGEIELGRTAQAILVPERAVLRAADTQVVVLARDGRAVNVEVKLLGRHAGQAAVEGKVHEHDRVIVDGGYNLPEGAGIVLRNEQ